MRLEKWIPIGVGIIIAIIILSSTFYIVDETQQVVITEFGQPVGKPITRAGLYVKKPFIQKVNRFEKRLLTWDGSPTQIPTKDKKYIWVDTTARWKIVDPLKFLQSVGSEREAHARLDDIIDSATRDKITAHSLYEIVRNTNREFIVSEVFVQKEEETGEVLKGRERISREILKEAAKLTPQYGIELVDVRIKRLNYVEEVRQKVYARMISERKRVAEQYRSEGQGKKAGIEGMREKELQRITSEAYKRAQIIKGEADAKATRIYAQAYSKDPEFYSFLKTLETYTRTLSGDSVIILTTDSELYKYLKSIKVK
ncbi:MAG TPA: protease modulator HflC [Candidatus Aerophobetes bacterium]|uniref:Protein HflC n=1 Tax=Aerophobetes bacterium TaxID=2030807 RepID=A0A7V5I024_UNCAE|nr:protease modulator HflC [Candidatus Aerophobetes bacterium]